MKKIYTIFAITLLAAFSMSMTAQDYPEEYLGLPGDNLNLYAVMNLFQESKTLEKFELKLNDQEATINNLDLNGDNYVDYITVSDYEDGNIHNIVLRTAINEQEQQDIAVFVVEKLRNGEVQIQLIGDEDLYGKNYIVEPIYADTPNPGYTGNSVNSNNTYVTSSYQDIARWPVVTYMYRPGYVVWHSSWNWGHYPRYWSSWHPHYYHYYYGYHYNWNDHYYKYYRPWNQPRCGHYHTNYYTNVRKHSNIVNVNITNKKYRTTYSRPEQRTAGTKHYTNVTGRTVSSKHTALKPQYSRSRSAATRQSTPKNVATSPRTVNDRSRSTTTTTRSRSTAGTANTRSSSSRSKSTPASRTTSSSSRKSTPTTRSSSSRSKSTPVTRSSSSSRKSTPVTKSSSSSRKSTPVTRSSSSRSKSTPVTRSSSSRSKSTPTTRTKSSSSKKSTPVTKSSSSKKSSSARSSKSGSSKSSSSRSSGSRN